MNVLLLGGGLQGLSFGESLYKSCRISVVSNEFAIRKSRFFDRVYPISEASEDASFIRKLLSEQKYDVIVPMSDKFASLLSRNKVSLENEFQVKCAVPDVDALSIVENKSVFMEFCQRENIPHPKTVRLKREEIQKAIAQVGFPALIKPDFSVGGRGIVRVNNEEELVSHLAVVEREYGPCSLQEFIDNPDYYYNVMLFRDSKGNCINHTVIKILRMYPVRGGSSSFCISEENPSLVSVCEDVLHRLGWVGMADFDVLQKRDSGEFRIIEINPRVPASLRSAYVSGVNFPELIVKDTCGISVLPFDYQPGKALRYLGLDIMWFLYSNRRWKQLASWLCFWKKSMYYQDVIKSDYSTWYSWLVTGVQKVFAHR